MPDTTERKMKDSGITVVPSIPEPWTIKRIKYILSERNQKVSDATPEQLLSVSEYYGVAPRSEKIKSDEILVRADTLGGYKICKKNDMVINIMLAWKGALGTSAYEGVVSPAYCVHYPKGEEIDMKYLQYLFTTDTYKNYFRQHSTGIIDSRLRLYTDAMYALWCIVPPVKEQHLISAFLDCKCTEIDALRSDIEKEIETLEEYKKSIITEAVTKGLDPNMPMKDSGIEWIGEIPAHWAIQKGKYLFEQKSDRGNSKSLVLLSPTQNYGVIPQDLYEELSGFSAVKLNDKTDYNSLKTVHKGAFVISLRSFQGGFEYSEYEGVVSPAYQVFYPTVPVFDGYYKYLFKTKIFIDKMNSYTMSLRDGKNIAFFDFGRTYIPVPPVDEQKRISSYLDETCSELSDLILKKQEQLNSLDDYKKSIIYEYVTGKKEVPDGNV